MVKPIKSLREHGVLIKELSALIERQPKSGTRASKRLENIALRVCAYETAILPPPFGLKGIHPFYIALWIHQAKRLVTGAQRGRKLPAELVEHFKFDPRRGF